MIGNQAADYETLVRWWNDNAPGRPIFIGQDVERTVKFADAANPQINQTQAKYTLQRSMPNVQGSCQWYAKAVCDNPSDYASVLKQSFHRVPALQPLMPWLDSKAPSSVSKLMPMWMPDGYVLFWTAPKAKHEMDRAVSFVVYRFAKGEKVNLDDASKIVAITGDTFYRLPYKDGKTTYTYVVTALDRLHNESKPVR